MGKKKKKRRHLTKPPVSAKVKFMTINEIILNEKATRIKQVTRWKMLKTGDGKLCIVEVVKGEHKGRVLIARKANGKITSLKDVDRSFLEEWYKKSVKIYKLNFKSMSKDKAGAKKPAPKKAAKKPAAKEKKGPGVIASIQEFIEKGPVKETDIVKKLVKRFPDKAEASMTKTVKAQVGSNKRPVRMEREKGIELEITVNEKTKVKTYSIKK